MDVVDLPVQVARIIERGRGCEGEPEEGREEREPGRPSWLGARHGGDLRHGSPPVKLGRARGRRGGPRCRSQLRAPCALRCVVNDELCHWRTKLRMSDNVAGQVRSMFSPRAFLRRARKWRRR
jgi:hypothetical protein